MSYILVTGANGFVGKHLVNELASRDLAVIGVGHKDDKAHPTITPLLHSYYKCDVTQADQVAQLPLAEVSCVINLAGLSKVGASFDNPELYMETNVKVLSILGEALSKANPSARMIAVSTGAVYAPGQSMPLSEDAEVITKGAPYVLSKLAMEEAAAKLREQDQDCIVVRPFNHIGPGQELGFLIPDLATKLKSTDPDNPSIIAGNLKTIRDYTDVRDIVRAYADLATTEKLQNNLYNVCCGVGRSGEDILRELCSAIGIDFQRLDIETDPSLVRPNDQPKIVGSSSRLQKDTNWTPAVQFSKTIKDIVATV